MPPAPTDGDTPDTGNWVIVTNLKVISQILQLLEGWLVYKTRT